MHFYSFVAWGSIQNLGFTEPIEDFIGSIQNATVVVDIMEAEDKVSSFIDQFCTGPSFDESEKVG